MNDRMKKAINNVKSLDKEIVGLEGQLKQYHAGYKELNDVIKFYTKNRNKFMSAIVGGNLIRQLTNKETLENLHKRKNQLKISIESAEEQLSHREDQLAEEYLKLYDYIQGKIPKEFLSDEDGTDE